MSPESLAAQIATEPGEGLWAVVVSLLVLAALLTSYFLIFSLHRRWIRKRHGFDLPVRLGDDLGKDPR